MTLHSILASIGYLKVVIDVSTRELEQSECAKALLQTGHFPHQPVIGCDAVVIMDTAAGAIKAATVVAFHYRTAPHLFDIVLALYMNGTIFIHETLPTISYHLQKNHDSI